MSNPNVTFAPGQRIGSYEMLLELASGGTATVGIAIYRGAGGFERLVVIKRVHRHLTRDGDFTAMLLDEARLASSVRHPNVVPVIDVVRSEGEVVLVMDYVESVSLAQLGKELTRTGARLPIAVTSRILCDVLWGLHEAHEAVDIRRQPLGIVHRDVSPQNIVVGVDGVSRVIDFGIAKARSRITNTRAGTIKGKCAYMAPEQVDGQPVDRRCDVFAAGIVLWEALTGKRLFRGEDEFDEMRRVMRAPIPPPSSENPECGPDVDAVLSHALARPLEERFQTARAFARALEQTIPPASPALVAEQVEALCGTELQYRHGRLQAILGDELDKLSPRATVGALTSKPALPVATDAPAVSLREPTRKLTPAVSPRPAALPSATLRSGEASTPPVPETPAESGEVLPGRTSLTPTLVVVMIVSVLAGAGVATAWLSRTRGEAPVPSSGITPTSAPVAAGAPSSAVSAAATAPTAPPSSSAAAAPPPPSAAPRPTQRPAFAAPLPSAPAPRELKSNPYAQ